MSQGTAVIIGAGPAGLTAAFELQRRTGIRPVVIEATNAIGGISRTVRYKGKMCIRDRVLYRIGKAHCQVASH